MIISIGEVLIDFISDEAGTLSQVDSFQKCPGGAPANFAVGIAKLGLKVLFLGKVGSDPFGNYLVDYLQKQGVNIDYIKYSQNKERTALAFVSLDKDLERDFLFYRRDAADLQLSREEIDASAFINVNYLHFGTVSLTNEPSRSATLKAIKECKKAGGKVCFDPNIRFDLWESEAKLREVLDLVLQDIDILYPSEEELNFLVDNKVKSKEAIDELMKTYPIEIIALKKGKNGCAITSRSNYFVTIPSFNVPVVDTTGAGDGFNTGFIFGLAQGKNLEEAGIIGNAVGALVIQKKGAMTALPTLTELREFLINNKVKISI
ncbi:MAG: carbohydrate kinase family protein [Candidatus Heimdallarchaeota archaeon]